MASAYPGGLDTFATNKANATATTTDHPTHHNDLADAVNKIEAELGISPSGAEATVAARFTALGGGASFVGADNSSVSWLAPPVASAFYARKFTVASEGILQSVGVYIRQTVGNVWGVISVAVYTHSTDQPGIMLASNSVGGAAESSRMLQITSTPTARWFHEPVGCPIETAGDYWMVVTWPADSSSIELGFESGAGTGVSGRMTSGGAWYVEKGATGAGWTADTDEYMIRGLFLATNIA